MKFSGFLVAVVVLMFASSTLVAADTEWSQVSWFTAESVAHSISYGVYNTSLACSQTAIYYVEPAVIDGDETKINASTDNTGDYTCQNSTQGVMIVSNDGSVAINITGIFNTITSGVTMKVGTDTDAWQASCSGSCDASACDLSSACLVVGLSNIQINYNMSQNTTQEYWWWADFSGVVGTAAPTYGNLTTTAVKYA